MTAEAGTHVTVTVGEGPSAAKVPDLRTLHPEETTPMPGASQTGAPNDRGSASWNVEQRPLAGTEVEPEDPVGHAGASGSNRTPLPALADREAQEDFASYDYASWLEESWQYDAQ